jgi:hypothetical protein
VGSFLSIESQSDACRDSVLLPINLDPEPQLVLPVSVAQVGLDPAPALASQRPIRRFTRDARGLDVFSRSAPKCPFGCWLFFKLSSSKVA